MRLLVVTQKIDCNDDILGFFHGWIKEFSKRFESFYVICLEKGKSNLPGNVEIFSLGKETKNLQPGTHNIFDRIKYGWKFLRYIVKTRNQYDKVFVHMNQEYVLLGGIFWKLFGKKVYLWRNHQRGSFLTRLAVSLCDKVFCTSNSSFTARFKKTILMPVGIDTALFNITRPVYERGMTILSLGRLDPIKRVHKLASALILLEKEFSGFRANIVGKESNGNRNYVESIKNNLKDLIKNDKIVFSNSVSNNETPNFYNSNKIFVNLTPSGSFDKTIIEAMACGSIVVVANDSVFDIVSEEGRIIDDSLDTIAKKIKTCLYLSSAEAEKISLKYRDYVLKNHSLDLLAKRLVEELK